MISLNLNDRVANVLSRDNARSMAAHNNASRIGHPCVRFLYYIRSPLDWDKSTRHGGNTLRAFWMGREIEKMVLDIMRRSGYQVTDEATSFYDQATDLSGKLDCQVIMSPAEYKSERYPVEIKSMQPWVFDKVNEAKDFLAFPPEKWYYHAYYSQLNAYLFMRGVGLGYFVLFNKATGELKDIPMALDWANATEISDKCTIVNNALQAKEPPIGVCDPDICPNCAYYAHCNPALDYGGGIDLDVPENALELLNEMEELDPARKRYEQLAEARKGMFKGKVFTVGKYLVSGKYIKRTGYEPDKTKPVSSEYWKISVKSMEGDAE